MLTEPVISKVGGKILKIRIARKWKCNWVAYADTKEDELD